MEFKEHKFLQGGGEMGELIRSVDWAKTPMGSPESWPVALKIATSIMLSTPFPMYIAWGKEYIQLYNDGYRPILGSTKHPQALGISPRETFSEIWTTIGPMFDDVMEGIAVGYKNFKLPLERNGYVEECYFDFSYSPIRDEDGNIGGVLVTVIESTENVKVLESLHHAKKEVEHAKIETEKQRDRLTRFLMEAPAGICVLDGPELVFELVNPGYQQFFPNRDLIGKPLLKAIPELVSQPIEKIIFDVYHHNKTFEGKELLVPLARTVDGPIEDRYFNFIYQPKHNLQGEVDGVLVFAFEVTELVAIKLMVEESRERFKSMIDQSPVPMMVTMGDEMIFEEINPPMLALIDKDITIKGKPLKEMMPELEGQPLFDQLIETYQTGKSFNGLEQRVFLNRKNKEGFGYFNVSYRPFFQNGVITGVLQSAIDVTEQVMSRKALEKAEDTLKLSLSAAQLGTFDLDLENGSLMWDTRCRTLFGISHQNEVRYEQDFVNGLHPEDRERVLKVIDEVFDKSIRNGHYDVEYRTVGVEDQKIRWIRAMGKAYFDANEKPVRFIGSVLDITEFKQDELRKNDFIGMVSHELKTPLTSLNGFAQILQLKSKNKGDDYCADVLGKMIHQIKKMTSMINGFLNVSRLESGKIHLEKGNFDFNKLLSEIIEETRLTTTSHTLKFEKLDDEIMINADKDKIGSVISNLISNAIKYSPKGNQVELISKATEGNLMFCVKDEGMGIPQYDLERLFDRYYRVETSEIQHISGFGIGLYLSAEIIQRHQGKIWAESELGSGSTFCFTLPLEA